MEVIVALAVLAIVLTAVGVELGIQATSVSTSRNKQVAEGLITRAFSQVRALPYTVVVNGLRDGDPTTTGTPHITKNGSTWTFVDSTQATHGTGEQICHSAHTAPATPNPLDPHTATSTPVNHITYTISVFPTYYTTQSAASGGCADPTGVIIRLTAIASWTTPHRSTPESITSQTLVYSVGTSCDPGHPQPFAAPCKPNFVGSASAGGGSIQVTPASTTQPLYGSEFQSIDLALPLVTTTIDLLQNTSVAGTAQATSAALTPGSTTGRVSRVSSGSSNDPASTAHAINTPNHGYNHTTLAQSPTASRQLKYPNRDGNRITVTPSTGDSGSSTSTISATATNNCDPVAGVTATDTAPCGNSTAQQAATASVVASLFAGDTSLGTATLASVAPTTQGSGGGAGFAPATFAAHYAEGQASCPSATPTTAGCIAAGAQMGLGAVTLGQFPDGLPTLPAGWDTSKGLIHLSGFSATSSTTAIASTSTSHVPTPSVSVPGSGATAAALTYWNGTTYTSVPLEGSTVAATIPTVTQADQISPTVSVTVAIGGSFSADIVSTSTSTTSTCTTACTSTGSVQVLVAHLTYVVTQSGMDAPIADLAITVNLGSISTHSSYQKAT